jgi:hypothetical protein
MYSCLQRERSLLECLWLLSALGLDRRPDLEWRLIARYRQAHRQPKLYLDAVGGQPGAVLAVRPQSVYVRCASLLNCCKLTVHHVASRTCVQFNQAFLRNQPTHAPTSNGAQSAALSAASKGRPRSFPSAKLSTLIGAKQLKSLTSLRSSGQIHFNPGPDTFQGSTVCAFESVNPSCDSWPPSVYGPANVACREDHFTKPGQGVPALCCVGASCLVRTNHYSDVPKIKPVYYRRLH